MLVKKVKDISIALRALKNFISVLTFGANEKHQVLTRSNVDTRWEG